MDNKDKELFTTLRQLQKEETESTEQYGYIPPSKTPPSLSKPTPTIQEIKIVDINMPMRSMIEFMVKWAIASIPAGILLGALAWTIWRLLTSLSNIG